MSDWALGFICRLGHHLGGHRGPWREVRYWYEVDDMMDTVGEQL